jgi:ribose 5-phosphate isomerase A
MTVSRQTTVFEQAADMVRAGDRVGLGSGRASARFIETLGARVRAGLVVQGFPTSLAAERQAREQGIPLLDPADAADGLDIAVDGADQFTPTGLDLIKGFGRCALREMVVARLAARFVILVGPGKRAGRLGELAADGRPMRLPVEVTPFAEPFVARAIDRLGLVPEPWCVDGCRGLTDDRHHILDCRMEPVDDPTALDRAIRGIPGVVGTGFFLHMADRVLEGDESFRMLTEYVRDRGVEERPAAASGPRGRQPR